MCEVSEQSTQVIYRYLPSQYAIKSMQTNLLRLGKMSLLNDVFDCSPTIDPGEHRKESFMRTQYMDVTTAGIINLIDHNLGVLSFCGEVDNLLVWAHYGSSYSGIALGYDQEILKHTYKDHMVKVDYSRECRPQITIENIGFKNPTDFYSKLIPFFSSKAKDWEYEKEERIFVDLDKATIDGENFFHSLPPGSLKEVVVGSRCKIPYYTILRSLNAGGHDVEKVRVRWAEPDPVSYKLSIYEDDPMARRRAKYDQELQMLTNKIYDLVRKIPSVE